MLAEERFALILNLLAEKRTATVQELCEALNASVFQQNTRLRMAFGLAGGYTTRSGCCKTSRKS